MHVQLSRARKRTNTQHIELAMDMMVVFSGDDEKNANNAIIVRLLKKLELHSMEETNILDDPTMPKMLDSCTSLVILDEFLCPITLEIMTYPIIVTSDQVIVRDRGSSNMEQPKAKA
ncbi:hypothetical protein JHK87_015949 [Glycine soja]|nr:hypothetical protein JHK87_015949 [Glycine soja]